MRQKQKSTKPILPTEYPVGSFIKTEAGYFYIAAENKRYRITTERILHSWSPQRLIFTTEAAVKKYRIAAKMKFRNGTLIHNLSDGRIYLIVSGKRCPVVSPEAFERIGSKWNSKDIITVSKGEIELHEMGDEIS